MDDLKPKKNIFSCCRCLVYDLRPVKYTIQEKLGFDPDVVESFNLDQRNQYKILGGFD